MPTARAELLIRQLDIAWALFRHHSTSLDDAACLWEPAPGCWTVRPDSEGRWTADWQVPEPDPVPTTSIGWLTWHTGFWWTTTLGHCFGSGAPEREEIFWPGSAAATIDWLGGLHDEWRANLQSVTDAELDSTERTKGLPWGQDLALVDIAGWVTVELSKNVSEIGLMLHLRKALGDGTTEPAV